MGIEFRRTLEKYSPIFQEMLDQYFPEGRVFESLNDALNQEYEPGKTLRELFKVGRESRTARPENLSVILEEIREVDVLWRQYVEDGPRIELQGIPVLRTKYVS